MKKFIITLVLTYISLFASTEVTNMNNYLNNKKIVLNIKYLDFNNISLNDRFQKDKKHFKEWLNNMYSPIFIAANVKEPTSLSFLELPYTMYYTINNIIGKENKTILGVSDMVNEYFKVTVYRFEDEKNLYPKRNINMFKLNDYLIIYVDFSDKVYYSEKDAPKSVLRNIQNLNKVILWSRKNLIQNRKVIIVGKFGLPYRLLFHKVNGFIPIIKNGPKIIKKYNHGSKAKYYLENNINILKFEQAKNIKAEVDFSFKRDLQNKKYHGYKKTHDFMKNVSTYYPINIYVSMKIKKVMR